jgi:hypothetical protein
LQKLEGIPGNIGQLDLTGYIVIGWLQKNEGVTEEI